MSLFAVAAEGVWCMRLVDVSLRSWSLGKLCSAYGLFPVRSREEAQGFDSCSSPRSEARGAVCWPCCRNTGPARFCPGRFPQTKSWQVCCAPVRQCVKEWAAAQKQVMDLQGTETGCSGWVVKALSCPASALSCPCGAFRQRAG